MTDPKKIIEWGGGYEPLFVTKLISEGLNDKQIISVLKAVDSTCHYCWDADDGCQCWNDE